MNKVLSFLEGKKTYLVALVAGCVAAAQSLGYDVPSYVFEILTALGLYTMRSAIANK